MQIGLNYFTVDEFSPSQSFFSCNTLSTTCHTIGPTHNKKKVWWKYRRIISALIFYMLYRRLPYSYTKLSYLYTNLIASFLSPHGNLIKMALIENVANIQGYNLL